MACVAFAQERPAADPSTPQTRAGLIESKRRQKAAALKPDVPDRVERAIDYVQEHKVIEHVFQGLKGCGRGSAAW